MTHYRNLSHQGLIGLLKQSDKAAFTEIYERNKGILFVHALKLLRDSDAAQELIHEFFLSLLTKADTLNIHAPPNDYLNRAIRNWIFKSFSRKKISTHYIARHIAI